MSGDYSRWAFDPRNDTAAVLQQQGRILTDADWNEQAAATGRRIQAEALDVVGRAGVPAETPDAFNFTVAFGEASIGTGRAYVTVSWPKTTAPAPPPNGFQRWLSWRAPVRRRTAPSPIFLAAPAAGARKVAMYLKVWRRELTAIEDPKLIEPALGIDTTTRLQTIWQVKPVSVPDDFDPKQPLPTIPSFRVAEPPAEARLTIATTATELDPNPCQILPTGGYSGVENQLYRVEVHNPGPAGTATFKWSRDNATVAARITKIPDLDRLVVDRLGPDKHLSLQAGEWIEIIDDARELVTKPGVMRRIKSVDEDTRTVVLTEDLAAGDFEVDDQGVPAAQSKLRVRRWDHGDTMRDENGTAVADAIAADGTIIIPAAATALILEHGITVSFSTQPAQPVEGEFRTGDYWLIAARTDDPKGHEAALEPPRGIHAHYAALALIDGADIKDLRNVFPPLTGLSMFDALFYVAGDGQEVMPDVFAPADPVPLPVPPTVGVARGTVPVAGRKVQFSRTSFAGTINGGAGPVTVDTEADGTARVDWAIDATGDQATLEAQLLDEAGAVIGLPVRFSARTRRARTVAYEPGACPDLADVGTVQDALDRLCLRGGGTRRACSATVGEGGDFPTLDEAIAKLAEQNNGVVRICLLPGEHIYDGQPVDLARYLQIDGLGARVLARQPLGGAPGARVELANFEIIAIERRPAVLNFFQCASVVLRGLTVTANETLHAVDTFECETVRIRDCDLVAGRDDAGQAAALQMSQPRGPVWISGNNLVGGLALEFGASESRIKELTASYEFIHRRADGVPPFGPFEFKVNDRATLDLHQNKLKWSLLNLFPDNVNASPGFASARINDNVFYQGPVEVCASRVSLSGNILNANRPVLFSPAPIGVIYANSVVVTANTRTGNADSLILSAVDGIRAATANANLPIHPPTGP